MIPPDRRTLLTGILTPPQGYEFDAALATTYTLDPDFLLQVPLHLALRTTGQKLLEDPVMLLEAMERSTERLIVYSDKGHINVPSRTSPLYGLLEPLVHEVNMPGGGTFHPKVWVLRFRPIESSDQSMIRLAILSRNLTFDRSWDLSLSMDGMIGNRNIGANRELGEFIFDLPGMTGASIDPEKRKLTEELSRDLRRTVFELPNGYRSVRFVVPGFRGRKWTPEGANGAVVISPFLEEDALKLIADRTDQPAAVISREDSFAKISSSTLDLYENLLVMDEAAETEDGEEIDSGGLIGLHAKLFAFNHGWNTRMYVGSANCTSAAFWGGNIEVVAEIVGSRSQLGMPSDLIGDTGLGPLLTGYNPLDPDDNPNDTIDRTEFELDQVHRKLRDVALKIVCKPADGTWVLNLETEGRLDVSPDIGLRAWPLTVDSSRATALDGLCRGESVRLTEVSAANVTGIIAFEIEINGESKSFGLNLPIEGVPEERHGAIISTILNNEEGFLRYLLLMLGNVHSIDGSFGAEKFDRSNSSGRNRGQLDDYPLLEEMVRTFSREPGRLVEVKNFVDRLITYSPDKGTVVPESFAKVWNVFEQVLSEKP